MWTFLDEQKRNPNFFFIGIMNRDNKVPDQIKHRLGGSTIFFPAIEDPEKLLDIFKKVIARNPDIEFDKECNDSFFNQCFKSLKSEEIELTPRDYENIRFQVARLTRREERMAGLKRSAVRKIKQYHLTEAIHEVSKTYDRSGFGREHLNEEEWRDFNAVQNRIIEVKLQCAQKIQYSAGLSLLGPSANVSRPPGLDMNEAIEILEQEFSTEQRNLYMRVMKRKCLIERGFIDTLKQQTNAKVGEPIKKEAMKSVHNKPVVMVVALGKGSVSPVSELIAFGIDIALAKLRSKDPIRLPDRLPDKEGYPNLYFKHEHC